MAARTKILFLHGMESGPHGRKYQMLKKAGYNVISERMPCDRRSILRDPVIIGALSGALATSFFMWQSLGLYACFLTMLGQLSIANAVKHLYARRLLSRSANIQQLALEHNPDIQVIIGSSFGGAVAVELLRRGAWTGPAVLLAPAQHKLATLAQLPLPTISGASRLLVVHGIHDEVVNIEDSRDLIKQSANPAHKLLEVHDDHRLSKTTPKALEEWIGSVLA